MKHKQIQHLFLFEYDLSQKAYYLLNFLFTNVFILDMHSPYNFL